MSTNEFSFYKQPPGAVDIDGSVMEPGWYYVRVRESATGNAPIPYGLSKGPFQTKQAAVTDATQRSDYEQC